jgi:excisionase family DNA binding protein
MTPSTESPSPISESRNPPAATLASPLIDIHGVAEVLGVTPRHIQRLVAERRIPYLKVGRFVRFDRAELSVWLNHQRVEPTRSSCCGRTIRR